MQYIIIAITFLATLITNLFTRSVSVVFEIMTKRILIIASLVTALAIFVSGFYLLINSLIAGIATTMPPVVSQAASLVIPDNFVTLVTIQVNAQIARWVYEWNVKVLQWRL